MVKRFPRQQPQNNLLSTSLRNSNNNALESSLTSRLTHHRSASIACSLCQLCSMTVHLLVSVTPKDRPVNTARSSVDSVHASRMWLDDSVHDVELDIMGSPTANVRPKKSVYLFHLLLLCTVLMVSNPFDSWITIESSGYPFAYEVTQYYRASS